MDTSKRLLCNNQVSEIGLVYKSKVKAADYPLVNSSQLAYKLLLKYWNPGTIELQEAFKIILVNSRAKAIGLMDISSGGVNSALVDPRLVFMAALKTRACSIILAHNHPSLGTKPSQADKDITTRLVQGGKLLDIRVLDHLIITPYSYYSFSDDGMM